MKKVLMFLTAAVAASATLPVVGTTTNTFYVAEGQTLTVDQVVAASNFASAILLEAGLSFLGIGVQPPMPSWGMMVKDYYGYLLLDSAYLPLLPGVAIMIIVLAFMLLANGLRDALDVKH